MLSLASTSKYLYTGNLDHSQFCLHGDGTLGVNSGAHIGDNEGTAREFRRDIKEAGGTVGPKTWWSGNKVVNRKKDASRYTQDLRIEHGTTRIRITLFVDLP